MPCVMIEVQFETDLPGETIELMKPYVMAMVSSMTSQTHSGLLRNPTPPNFRDIEYTIQAIQNCTCNNGCWGDKEKKK